MIVINILNVKINTSFHDRNKINDIKYMVVCIDAEKALEKIHHSFKINIS